MTRGLKVAAGMAAALALAGCAGTEIPFDRSSAGVRTIGVLTPDITEKPSVILASDIGQSFGLVGALVDVGMQLKRDDKLYTILMAHQFTARATLGNDLVAALRAQGYGASLVPVTREKSGFLKTYPAQPGIDAYLDVSAFRMGSAIWRPAPVRPSHTAPSSG